jgi:hypothetical protein
LLFFVLRAFGSVIAVVFRVRGAVSFVHPWLSARDTKPVTLPSENLLSLAGRFELRVFVLNGRLTNSAAGFHRTRSIISNLFVSSAKQAGQRAFAQARAALLIEGIREEITPELLLAAGVDANTLVFVKPLNGNGPTA